MSLPQIDTRSSLMRHSPSVMVGLSTSMNSKSLGPTSCAAFIPSIPPTRMLSKLKVRPYAPETGYTILSGWALSTSSSADSAVLALDAMGCGASPRAEAFAEPPHGLCATDDLTGSQPGWPLPASGWLTGWLD